MRGIGAVDHVDGADAGGKFLRDPLEQPLRAGALDLHGNAGIFCLERLAELLADRKVHRGIQHHLGFLVRRVDQLRRDGLGRRRLRRGQATRTRFQARARSSAFKIVAPGKLFALHRVISASCYRLNARQRSGGSVSQTSVPLGTAFSVDVTTRNVVPSRCLDHGVAAGAEKHLARHGGLDGVLLGLAAPASKAGCRAGGSRPPRSRPA